MRGSDSLTVDECDKLIAALDGADALTIRDRMLIEVMASTGLRVSEVAALKVAQVVDAGKAVETLHLDKQHTKRKKGGKLPLSSYLKGALVAYVSWLRSWYEGVYLFPGYKHKPLTTRAIQLRIHDLAMLCEIGKKITPHSLRKFFIQRLLDGGLDLRTVMELSRHSSLASLHHYLVVDEAAARAAVEKIR